MAQDFANRFISAIIVFLIVMSLLLLLGILISRTLQNRWEKREEHWHAVFQELLVQLLFDPEYARGGKKYKDVVIKYKANKLDWIARKTLIEQMMELHKGVKGDSAVIVKQFYRDIGLVKFQEEMITRGPWYKKAQAFRIYSEFAVIEKVKLIEKFVDHPNKVLRSEAQYAVVSILGAEGLKFVPKLKSPISEWEQLVLLEKLVKFKPEDIPNVLSWLDSKNDSVVIFATKIIHQFRLFDAQNKLLELLDHKNLEVVKHSIECMVRIEFKEACPVLRERYQESIDEIKIKILDALSRLGDASNLNFFREEIETSEKFSIAMGAAMALRVLGGDSILRLLNNTELKYPKGNEIVKHALDKRI
ncbi:MAG: hypothetical protein CL840_11435 [Crocinitomicaceae bacterium]|nr:hypothetical protein [Crocinitomicaceae bacterium]